MLPPLTSGSYRRRAAKKPVVLGESPPDDTPVGLEVCIVSRLKAEAFQRHALAEEEAQEVVIWPQQHADGVPERFVRGEPRRISVAVRA
jgi:hypothetical protein